MSSATRSSSTSASGRDSSSAKATVGSTAARVPGSAPATDLRLACGRGSPCALRLPRPPGTHPVRPPGRRRRLAREHHARLRRRRRPRVPLRRDRRPRHRRRRRAGLPRRGARPGHRPHRRDRRAHVARGLRGAGRRPRAHPAARGPPRHLARAADQHRPEARQGGRAARHRADPHRAPSTACASARSPTVASTGSAPMLGPGLCTSLGPAAVARLRAASYGIGKQPTDRLLRAGARRRRRATPWSTSASWRPPTRLDLAVHVWTIDEPDEMDRLLELGVDGIMTDRPAVLRDVLERRGQWFPAAAEADRLRAARGGSGCRSGRGRP